MPFLHFLCSYVSFLVRGIRNVLNGIWTKTEKTHVPLTYNVSKTKIYQTAMDWYTSFMSYTHHIYIICTRVNKTTVWCVWQCSTNNVRLEIIGTIWTTLNTFRGTLVGCFPYITSRHLLLPTRMCNIPPFVCWPNGFSPKGDGTTCRI